MKEAKKRDYKAEYKKYGSSKKAKKYRAELNKYNRQKGTYGNGDKKDASHKGGKIVGFEEQSKNRGRREKSRLKKESSDEYGKSLEKIANDKKLKSISKKDRDTLKKLAKLLKKEDTTITIEELKRLVKEELLDITEDKFEDHEGKMAKSQLERSMKYSKMIYKIIDNVGDGGEVKLPAWVQSKLTKAEDYLQSVYNYLDGKDGLEDKFQNEELDEAGSIGGALNMSSMEDSYTAPKRDTSHKNQGVYLQKFSSKEAQKIVDGQLKNMVQDIRKVEGRVIKTWMTAAKAGKIDFFDIIRGLKTGDIRRAHTFEMDFFVKLLTRNKIVDRFRSYFKGKKGKKR